MDEPTVTPDLACAVVEAKPQTCDCGVFLEVSNACASAISLSLADGFCSTDPEPRASCVVQPGEQAAAKLRLRELGDKTFDVELMDSDNNKHTIHFTSHVSSLDDGCYCALPGSSSESATARWLAAAAVLLGALVVRRSSGTRR